MLNVIAAVLLAIGQAGSAPMAAALARQTNVHYAWAHVLRVDPVYEMVPIPVARPDCPLDDSGARSPVEEVEAGETESTLPREAHGSTQPSGAGPAAVVAGGAVEDPVAATSASLACVEPAVPEFERQLTGFDVEYRFRGEVYFARLPYDPGGRLRVRVEVSPAE